MCSDQCAPRRGFRFAFMPMYARIPWVASTSLIWTCILSAMRGGSDVPAQAFVAELRHLRDVEVDAHVQVGADGRNI